MFYKGGSETIVECQDSNRWSYLEAIRLVRDWVYEGLKQWRKIPGLEKGNFHFIDHLQDEEIVKDNLTNNIDGHIRVEHDIEDMLRKVLNLNIDHYNKGIYDGSSDVMLEALSLMRVKKKE